MRTKTHLAEQRKNGKKEAKKGKGFYNLRGGKERIFNDMSGGFGWARLPKSFMAENTVFLLLTALIHNFYITICCGF